MDGPATTTEGLDSHAPSAGGVARRDEAGVERRGSVPYDSDLEGHAAGTLSSPEAESPRGPSDGTGGGSSGSRPRKGVLRHKHFRNVWIGSFGSSLGGWMEHVGIRWVMTEMTTAADWQGPDANAMISYLTAAALVPTLLLGMIAGLITDRVNRKKLLIISRLSMMLIALGLMLASALHMIGPTVLLVLSALQGVAIAFDVPASQVLTPRLVPREELAEAIHLQNVQFNMARVIGPALGGAILSFTGTTWLFAINTLSFLGVLFSVAGTPDAPAPPRTSNGKSILGEAKSDIAEAMSFVFRRRGPRAVFMALVVFAIFATPLMQLLPIFVHQVYHKEEGTFGSLLGVMGSGAVIGGFLVRRIPKWYPMHHFIPMSVLMGGVTIARFAAMPSGSLAGPFLFLGGIFWIWAFSSANATMQLLVDDAMRGRVLAVCNTVAMGLMPVGTFAAGWVGRLIAGPADTGNAARYGVAACALVLVGAGLIMLLFRTPEVDGHQPGEPGKKERGLIEGLLAREHRPRNGEAPVAGPARPMGGADAGGGH